MPFDKVQMIVDKGMAGSNWDMAFREGYKGLRCKYQRNWTLYPIYVAGKEYRKINKIQDP